MLWAGKDGRRWTRPRLALKKTKIMLNFRQTLIRNVTQLADADAAQAAVRNGVKAFVVEVSDKKLFFIGNIQSIIWIANELGAIIPPVRVKC